MLYNEEWQEAAARNKQPRLNWRRILGKSMNQYVAEEWARGKSKEEIIENIWEKVRAEGWDSLDSRIYEKIRIGVSARIGEMKSEKTALKKTLAEQYKWIARVKEASTGLIIYVSPKVGLKKGQLVEVSIRPIEEKK